MKIRKDLAPAVFRNALTLTALLLALLLTPSLIAAVTYEYDELNRLTRVVYDDGKTITYAYDAAGNITATNEVKDRGDDSGGSGACFIASASRGNQWTGTQLLKFLNRRMAYLFSGR